MSGGRAAALVDSDERFQEIPRERVADRVAHELLRLISSGQLAPGERLPGERQLAEMMNVSRVSIRAALQQLKTQGFVSAVQGGGTRVIATADDLDSALSKLVKADRQNLHDLAEIRMNIEVWAARRAAERASDQQIREIENAFRVMDDPDRPERFKAEDDHHFHLAIAKAAGSAVYLHLMSVLGDVLEQMFVFHRYHLYAGSHGDRTFNDQHRAIAVAIRDRDAEAAAAAMAAHLKTVLSRYADADAQPAEAPDAGQDAGKPHPFAK